MRDTVRTSLGVGGALAAGLLVGLVVLLSVLFSGCEIHSVVVGPGPRPVVHLDGVAFRGATHVLESFPVQLRFVLEVENEAEERRTLRLEECGMSPRAYREPDRLGSPAWDPLRSGVCPRVLRRFDLEPGERRVLDDQVGAAEVLGDSLPAGTYHFTVTAAATVDGSGGGRRVEVVAGSAHLELAPPPAR